MNTEQVDVKIYIENMLSVKGLIYDVGYGHVDSRITPEHLIKATSYRKNSHLEFLRQTSIEVKLLPAEKNTKLKRVEIPNGYRAPYMTEFLHFIVMYMREESSNPRHVWDGQKRGRIILCGDVIDCGPLFALALCWYGSRYSGCSRALGLIEYFDEPLGEHDWLLWVKK